MSGTSNKRILNNFSKQLKKANAPILDIEDGKGGGVFDQIKACQEKNKSFKVTFPYSTYEGDLKALADEGIVLIMTESTLKEDIPYYSVWIKDRYLGIPLDVKVREIDEANKTVYLQLSGAKKKNSKSQALKIIFDELDKKASLGEAGEEKESTEEKGPVSSDLVVAGRVVQVHNNKLIVNILGLGILGFCYLPNWKKSYTRTFENLVHVGEVYDFEILRQMPKKRHKDYAFELSRANLTPDPWKNLPAEFTQVGAVLMVKCIEKPVAENKRYWWGRSELLPDIEIMGDYAKKVGKVMLGVTYKCKVNRVEPDKHMFRVVPFDVSDNDMELKKAVDFIQSRR